MAPRRSAVVVPGLTRDELLQMLNIGGGQPQLMQQEGVELQPHHVEEEQNNEANNVEGVAPQPQEGEAVNEANNVEGVALPPQEGEAVNEAINIEVPHQHQEGENNVEPNWLGIHNLREFVFWVTVIAFVTLAFSVAYRTRNDDNVGSLKCADKVVVALTSGAHYNSISSALMKAPERSNRRFCIVIKSGIYRENIVIGRSQHNIALIGEGANNTIIMSSGMQNHSATIEVIGNHFTAINLTFENPGTTVYTSSREVVFYNCRIIGNDAILFASIDGFFFRDCQIFGSNSVVRGHALAFFQNCRIYISQDSKLEHQVIAKQGGFSYKSSSFVFDRCTFEPISGKKDPSYRNSTYLGCPQGAYSTIVIMRSFITSIVNPKGWTLCDGYQPQHLLYGEFNNTGPGAYTKERVHWDGIKVLKIEEASKFMLKSFFIQNTDWISSTGIPYSLN